MLRRPARALILALITTLFGVVAAQAYLAGMAIAVRRESDSESDNEFGRYFEWLQSPLEWGPLWLFVALGYPAVLATLWHTDLRRSVPAVLVVLLVSAGLSGLVGRYGCGGIVGLPSITLGALIWCARRWGKEPAALRAPAEEDTRARRDRP